MVVGALRGQGEAQNLKGVLPITSHSWARRRGDIEAGQTPHYHPAGDAPCRGRRDHADPPCRWPHRQPHGVGHDPPVSRSPSYHLGCRSDRGGGTCRRRAKCRWPTMACSSRMSYPSFHPCPGVLRQPLEEVLRPRPSVGRDHVHPHLTPLQTALARAQERPKMCSTMWMAAWAAVALRIRIALVISSIGAKTKFADI